MSGSSGQVNARGGSTRPFRSLCTAVHFVMIESRRSISLLGPRFSGGNKASVPYNADAGPEARHVTFSRALDWLV